MWEDTSHTASLAQSKMAPARRAHLGTPLVRDIIARATLALIMGAPMRGRHRCYSHTNRLIGCWSEGY